ncbi:MULTISPECIES: VOC family protein [Pseudomonas]|uniref:Glyoxalase-like domain protein n=1 Tax=Pseudomonas putida TaxID=303 RepID=A0A1B2F5Y6_PSEPU|nr:MULTISPECIES: VOC family protein [Pseudomonas]ANY87564.1 Glyoxalase-like domain protein [Pseudomonas putida]MCL8308247.1 VOC family protein [Pseudomonas putida]
MHHAAPQAFDQLGFVVQDLDQSINHWLQLGVGPWTVFRDVQLQGNYQGQAVEVRMNVGLAYQGGLQIELIHTTSDGPSPYRDAQGLHHMAWLVDELDSAVARLRGRGLRPVFEAGNATTRVCYLENPNEPGVLFEVIEGAGLRQMIDHGIAQARDWDGEQPVRVFAA